MNVCHRSSVANEWPEELRLKIADSLFNNSSEGICITDASEQIVEVNPTFCKTSGYSREELLGKSPRVLASGLQDRDFFVAMWADLLDVGEWHGELWNRKKSGDLFAVRLNISAICNAAGEVSHYLAIMADVTAMKVQQQEWEKNANHDQLTGLPNRTLLMDRLHQAMAQSIRTNLVLAICYLDLDGFKPINDIHGHKAGDTVLVEVAERLHRSVREGDTVARVGGDEFVLLLWGLAGVEECNHTLARVISEIDRPIAIGHAEVSVTASIGVTVFPQDGKAPVLLTAQADSAMYRSKVAGGNRFTFF
ncbi:MAG: sensor domain-containing diguanylate cyclase [Sterolibacterium sp.]|nr:sensor domain-containing diguanylate cyclase [Sterolibacterium sp.]